ncbi:hypothetical protein [Kribbella sp. NPDC004875]|uniref:hypothetical protein n=1 Tax=Kribbella sp. NPDC004875 TaxID=3364107 RepID=UPI00367F1C52
MIDDLGKLLDRVSSPVDLAVVLLSGPLAFLLDAGFDLVPFLPPGYVAVVVASFALGVRKVVEARLTPLREQRDGDKRRQQVRARADALRPRVVTTRLGARLEQEVELYDAGITTEEQFAKAVTECVDDYRYVLRTTFDSGVAGQQR